MFILFYFILFYYQLNIFSIEEENKESPWLDILKNSSTLRDKYRLTMFLLLLRSNDKLIPITYLIFSEVIKNKKDTNKSFGFPLDFFTKIYCFIVFWYFLFQLTRNTKREYPSKYAIFFKIVKYFFI